MIDDIARETVSVTAEFLYAVDCLLCLRFCSQQQNRNSVVCAGFLCIFLSWKCVLRSNITIGQKGKWKAFILYTETSIVLSCLVCHTNREDVKTQEDRTEIRRQDSRKACEDTAVWDTVLSDLCCYPYFGEVKKTKDRIQRLFRNLKREGSENAVSLCSSFLMYFMICRGHHSSLSVGGSLAMQHEELSVSSTVGWGLFFVAERCMYEAFM